MKARIFSLLAIILIAVLAVSCQKDDLFDPSAYDGLYLKSATSNEVARMYYFNQNTGEGDIFYYPADLLFSIEADKAEILNRFMLKVDDFTVLEAGEAVFRVSEFGSSPLTMGTANGQALQAPSSENVYAHKLPFTATDYGPQGNEGGSLFNGLIKAHNYVFAIKNGEVKAYDLDRGLVFTTVSNFDYKRNHLSITFREEPSFFSLIFLESSPTGNLFTLSWSGGQEPGYTLAR